MNQTTSKFKHSKGHIAFARKVSGAKGADWTGVDDQHVTPYDYEFFVGRDGHAVFRAQVSEPLVLRKGKFMGRVRNACFIMVGADLALWLAQKLGGDRPKALVNALIKERECARQSKASGQPEKHTTPKTTQDLPDGWTLEIKTTQGKTPRKYKVFHAPDGKKFQSFKKAQRYMLEATGANGKSCSTEEEEV